jgi:hypothetical protein
VGQRNFHSRGDADSKTISDPVDESEGLKRLPSRAFPIHGWDYWAIRFALIGATCILCYILGPFGIHGLSAAALVSWSPW